MRTIYLVPALIAAMALSCAASLAQTVKVGVINTYSGPFAAVGEQTPPLQFMFDVAAVEIVTAAWAAALDRATANAASPLLP